MKDTLFLLPAGFPDPKVSEGLFYCASCAHIEGLLAYRPQLREVLDIVYLDYPRPRAQLVELLGEEHQSCPVLVLGQAPATGHPHLQLEQVAGRYVAKDADQIAAYLAARYGTPAPHP